MKERLSELKARSAALLANLRRQGKLAMAAAALVPLGAVAVDRADGQLVVGAPRSSYVGGTTTPQVGGDYQYEFTVYNTTDTGIVNGSGEGNFENHLIVNWELPLWDADTDTIRNILSPSGWFHEIVLLSTGEIVRTDNDDHAVGGPSFYFNNPDGPYGQYGWDWVKETDPDWIADNDVYGPNPDAWLTPTYILHWYTEDVPELSPINPIPAGASLAGFSFESDYGAGNTPYQASWFEQPPTTGDPPSPTNPPGAAPMSPNFPTNNVVIPEPLTAGLSMVAGMAILGYVGRRRR